MIDGAISRTVTKAEDAALYVWQVRLTRPTGPDLYSAFTAESADDNAMEVKFKMHHALIALREAAEAR